MSAVILRLSLLALICGFALSTSNLLSKDQIETNQSEYEAKQLQAMLKNSHVDITRLEPDVYQLSANNRITGHIFSLSTNQGYNGKIKLLLAVSVSDSVLGVRVIEHRETPGLADDLDHDASDWILSFNNHTLQTALWQVEKDGGDFDQFTGATITPRAVVAAVRQGLINYQVNKEIWIANER